MVHRTKDQCRAEYASMHRSPQMSSLLVGVEKSSFALVYDRVLSVLIIDLDQRSRSEKSDAHDVENTSGSYNGAKF